MLNVECRLTICGIARAAQALGPGVVQSILYKISKIPCFSIFFYSLFDIYPPVNLINQ